MMKVAVQKSYRQNIKIHDVFHSYNSYKIQSFYTSVSFYIFLNNLWGLNLLSQYLISAGEEGERSGRTVVKGEQMS